MLKHHRFRTFNFVSFVVLSIVCLLVVSYAPAAAQGVSIRLISAAPDGSAADDRSSLPAMSADGRYIAFYSWADNLVAGDTNGGVDIFVRDLLTETTKRINLSSPGTPALVTDAIAIDGDGHVVAFGSYSNNLVPGDTNNQLDVFVYDDRTAQMTLVSVNSAGEEGNDWSDYPSLSDDGQLVAFASTASNLVPNDTNNFCGLTLPNCEDDFVHDMVTGQTTRVNVSSTGLEANNESSPPEMSGDGRTIAFSTSADNLVAHDTNHDYDVFVRDRQTGQTSMVSVSSSGVHGNSGSSYPSISHNGRFIVFLSGATNLVPGDTNNHVDVFVRDLQTGKTTQASLSNTGQQGNADSWVNDSVPAISDDGRFVAFTSLASNLVPDDTNNQADIFVRDMQAGKTARVSVSATGEEGQGGSLYPVMTPDGSFIAFQSSADNLVPGHDNGKADVYLAVNPLWTPEDAPARNFYTALPITLTWSRVPGAARYEVEADSSNSFTEPLDYSATPDENTLQATINTLNDGIYYWRVRAVDENGHKGAWSAVDSFRLDTTP